MTKNNKIIFGVVQILLVLTLLIFMLSKLRPYLSLFLSLLLLILTILWLKNKKSRPLIFIMIIFSFISLLYIFFPIKIKFTNNQNETIKITPILYGLPSEQGWKKIESGEYYPGGDVIGLLDPKYMVLIRK